MTKSKQYNNFLTLPTQKYFLVSTSRMGEFSTLQRKVIIMYLLGQDVVKTRGPFARTKTSSCGTIVYHEGNSPGVHERVERIYSLNHTLVHHLRVRVSFLPQDLNLSIARTTNLSRNIITITLHVLLTLTGPIWPQRWVFLSQIPTEKSSLSTLVYNSLFRSSKILNIENFIAFSSSTGHWPNYKISHIHLSNFQI